MSHVSDRFVVLLDANVLFPLCVRDALLRFAEAGLFRARWSRQILDEWQASLLARKPELAASLTRQINAMQRAFPEAMVTGHEGLLPRNTRLPDENDRHVIEAAIRCGAQHIITENVRDFPAHILEPFDIEATTADQFLASVFELYGRQAAQALHIMRQTYDNPPYSPDEFIHHLRRNNLGCTADLANEWIHSL